MNLSKTSVHIASDESTHCCGILSLHSYWFHSYEENQFFRLSGTGLYEASFINNSSSKEAYQILTKDLKLLYQSPVRRNKNTNNLVFTCIFSSKDRM